MSHRETQDEESWAQTQDHPVPGLLLVFSGGRAAPILCAIPLQRGRLALGREDAGGQPLDDNRMSREHCEIALAGGRWTVRDLDSRNGTFLDGVQVKGEVASKSPRTLRLGHSLFLFASDVRPYQSGYVDVSDQMVAGPTLRASLARVARAAKTRDNLLLTGESGSGKELAARLFHESGPKARGPFIAVNCAAIPEGVAERLLFGAKKGAYSGATADVDGYVQAADGGTLFLDEIAELDPLVQAKLLRVLEAREVLRLGASRARPVDLRFVCATNVDLRRAVAEKNFRADLYFRVGQPEVRLPPLRERLEEIPFLAARELARIDRTLAPHGKLIEACLLRPWPGNVRELLAEIRRAGDEALHRGTRSVRLEYLSGRAGTELSVDRHGNAAKESADTPVVSKETIEATLQKQGGNVAAAARALGLHRTQLYRLMKRHGVVVTTSS